MLVNWPLSLFSRRCVCQPIKVSIILSLSIPVLESVTPSLCLRSCPCICHSVPRSVILSLSLFIWHCVCPCALCLWFHPCACYPVPVSVITSLSLSSHPCACHFVPVSIIPPLCLSFCPCVCHSTPAPVILSLRVFSYPCVCHPIPAPVSVILCNLVAEKRYTDSKNKLAGSYNYIIMLCIYCPHTLAISEWDWRSSPVQNVNWGHHIFHTKPWFLHLSHHHRQLLGLAWLYFLNLANFWFGLRTSCWSHRTKCWLPSIFLENW